MYLLSRCTRFSPMSDRQCSFFFFVQTSKRFTMRGPPTCASHGHIYFSPVCLSYSYALAFEWNHREYTRNQKETGILVDNHTHTSALECNSFLPLLSCMSWQTTCVWTNVLIFLIVLALLQLSLSPRVWLADVVYWHIKFMYPSSSAVPHHRSIENTGNKSMV